jgi:hypothetical protein
MRVTDLIPGWGPYDINTRRARGCASLITKKSDMCFILARRRFSCRLGHCDINRRHILLDVRLLFDAPHGHPGY